MHYSRSSQRDIWVSLVEKEFTKIAASNYYQRLSDATKGPDANTVIEIMYGVKLAQAVEIQGKEDNELKALIEQAAEIPTIMRWAAPGANQAHAVTVEGLDVDGYVNWIDSLNGVSSAGKLCGRASEYAHFSRSGFGKHRVQARRAARGSCRHRSYSPRARRARE